MTALAARRLKCILGALARHKLIFIVKKPKKKAIFSTHLLERKLLR